MLTSTMSAVERVFCVIIGDVVVGKTCFLKTVVTKVFPVDSCSTVLNGDVLRVQLRNGKQVTLIVMDTCESRSFLIIVM